MNSHDITHALIGQVTRARESKGPGATELEVTTYITRPMWRAFLRELGDDENLEPTEWLGTELTQRVYGSYTVIIPGDGFVCLSV